MGREVKERWKKERRVAEGNRKREEREKEGERIWNRDGKQRKG